MLPLLWLLVQLLMLALPPPPVWVRRLCRGVGAEDTAERAGLAGRVVVRSRRRCG